MSAEGMPPTLLELFVARPTLECVKTKANRPQIPITPMTDHVSKFEETAPPPILPFETPKQRWARLKQERQEAHRLHLKQLISEYDPHSDANATRDPFSTLFVGRISYETTEKKMKREFEVYGPIRKLRLVSDRLGKARGYAFIEYESERPMKEAYKHGDGKKIDGRRVLVDVERGRTIQGWLPRRLGVGRGPCRFVAPKQKGAPPGPNLAIDKRLPPLGGSGGGANDRSSIGGGYGNIPDYNRRPPVHRASVATAANGVNRYDRGPPPPRKGPDAYRDSHRERRRSRSRSRSRGRDRDFSRDYRDSRSSKTSNTRDRSNYHYQVSNRGHVE